MDAVRTVAAEQDAEKTSSANANLSREFLIGVGQQQLIMDSSEAQKGSEVGAAGVLDTLKWLKSEGLLDEAAKGLEEFNNAKVHRDKNNEITEITFDAKHEGYPDKKIVLDVKNALVNKKNEAQLEKEARGEIKEFIDALVDAPNRKASAELKAKLNAKERETLRKVESGFLNGNISEVVKAFQNNPNKSHWERVADSAASDVDYPLPVKFAKDDKENPLLYKGAPYLYSDGISETGQVLKEALIIPAKGAPFLVEKDDAGEVLINKPVTNGRTVEQFMKDQERYRNAGLKEKLQTYRCEFDAHDRKGSTRGDVSWKEMVAKNNAYTDSLCMPD